jgi:putative molybdopterin biosynthesis protein
VLPIYASHDLALPMLRDLAVQQQRLHIDLRFAGSVDALRALAEGRCLVAGFHVPPLQGAAPVFAEALKPLLKPGRHKLISFCRRAQGLMVAKGNPLKLTGLPDATRAGVRFIQRQPGSGTRLLTDYLLQAHGLLPEHLTGGLSPEDSHMAVAAAIASGLGDAGMGLAAAAQAFGLDFVPVMDEDYFLVCLKDALDHPAVLKLRQVLASSEWDDSLTTLPGYRGAQGGEVLSLVRALPWWAFRAARAEAAEADSPAAAQSATS